LLVWPSAASSFAISRSDLRCPLGERRCSRLAASTSSGFAGSYRLIRLAVKYGAQILLDDLLVALSAIAHGAMVLAGAAGCASLIFRHRGYLICHECR
jgi:hypothetical protein